MGDQQFVQQVETVLINVSGPWSGMLAMVMSVGAFRPPLHVVNVDFENTVGGRLALAGSGIDMGLVQGTISPRGKC